MKNAMQKKIEAILFLYPVRIVGFDLAALRLTGFLFVWISLDSNASTYRRKGELK
jgi:hypothetical protein